MAAVVAGVAVGGAGGCVRYQAKPLDAEAVNRALAGPDEQTVIVAASQLKHPALRPVTIEPGRGLSPEEAAVVAVVASPDLRAERDRRGLADAQVLAAGILPNPDLTAGFEVPFHHDPADRFTALSTGLDWEVTALIGRRARMAAARAASQSVVLDVAWKEWQTALAAKTAAWDVIALQAQLAAARDAAARLDENLTVVRRAVERHEKTVVELSAAQTAAADAHEVVLALQKDLAHQRLGLNHALGRPVGAVTIVRDDGGLPSRLEPPAVQTLLAGLENRRLDLVALRKGYDSQEATLRAAILGQFPKITFGPTLARDTADVETLGAGATIALPIFDRNQGAIAAETATRAKLFDEYVARLYGARADVETAVSDIRATDAQIAAAEATLPELQRLVETYRAALGQGNVDVLSYYTAQTAVAQKRIDIVKLKQTLMENWVALEVAAGQYLPTAGGSATTTTATTTTATTTAATAREVRR